MIELTNLSQNQLEFFWMFARGDVGVRQFEEALYGDESIEAALGKDAYLDAISVDFRDRREIETLKSLLLKTLPKPYDCLCHTKPDRATVGLDEWKFKDFDVVERQVESHFWLRRLICKKCRTPWLVADEERVYDIRIVIRGSGLDVPELKSYRGLLLSVVQTGASVRYIDPMNSSELPAAIQTLAEETPGISIHEIAELLPVHKHVAEHHAKEVVAKHGLKIEF